MKTPLTVLIGAGMSEALGLPGVAAIDEHLATLGHPWFTDEDPPYTPIQAVRLLRRALLSYYDQVNFELILHSAELLYSIRATGSGYVDEINKPAFMAFMETSQRWLNLVGQMTTLNVAQDITGNIVN